MAERGLGNEVQSRQVLEQVAEAVLLKWTQEHPQPAPDPRQPDIPAPLKWAAGIVAGIMSAGALAMCVWVVTTLGDLQQTVTRIDERQQLTGSGTALRLDKIEERLMRLEQQPKETKE